MKKYLRYLNYLVKHKWFVFLEGCKEGIVWQGITHDISKFLPSEFFPYVEYFYGNKKNCWNCKHITESGGQCDLNWAGIGDGEQGKTCKDYIESGIKKGRDKTGYYKPTDTGDKAFDFAWLLHQKRNKHHWQWWVLPEDGGGLKILEMPLKYRKEMICDWLGAAKAQGYGDNRKKWYEKNKDKMKLGPETRKWIEQKIQYNKSDNL